MNLLCLLIPTSTNLYHYILTVPTSTYLYIYILAVPTSTYLYFYKLAQLLVFKTWTVRAVKYLCMFALSTAAVGLTTQGSGRYNFVYVEFQKREYCARGRCYTLNSRSVLLSIINSCIL